MTSTMGPRDNALRSDNWTPSVPANRELREMTNRSEDHGPHRYEQAIAVFMDEVQERTVQPHLFHVDLEAAPSHTLAHWLLVYAFTEHQLDNIFRLRGPSGHPTAASTSTPSGRQLAAWCDEVFKLNQKGVLARIANVPDEHLSAGVQQLLYQELIAVASKRYSRGKHLDPQEIAHEFLSQRSTVNRWCAQFDPSKGPLSGYLFTRARTNELRMDTRRILGLVNRTDRVTTEFDGTQAEPSFEDDAISRLYAAHLLPPRSQWPREVQLCYIERMTYQEAAKHLGISPETLGRRVRRWQVKTLKSLPPHQGPHGPDG